jgi:DNA-binding SARP family transcriptional activator/tetratricopeptide (TPR) repeat protein
MELGRVLEFRLLGPVDVLLDGRPAEISAPRQRIVLAMLLFEANRVVSVSRLVDAIWDEDPPATARSQVHISVSALRKLLGSADGARLIVTRSPGYLIQASAETFDLDRFERLVAGATTPAGEQGLTEAVTNLRAALALWRGPAAMGVESRLVEAAATRLNERRFGVLESCLDLQLQLGQHRDLIGELREVVAKHPLRERFLAQLMLALYRSGRQAEALLACQKGRNVLREELGLDLGEELRTLESAILANDPSLGLADGEGGVLAQRRLTGPPIPRELPKSTADFTGRTELLGQICRLLSQDPGGGMPIAVLTGPGGVGKTALALRAAHLLQDAYPDGQLYAQLGMRENKPAAVAAVLEQFLRSLQVAPSAVPRAVQARAGMYRSLLADRRVLVMLDDAASTGQVAPLVPGSRSCAVIVTARKRLSGLDGVRRFEVDALDEHNAIELLARLIGPERAGGEPEAVRDLAVLCGGLPLALRIAAARLYVRPHWRVEHLVRRLRDEKRRLDELNVDGVTIRAPLSFAYENLDNGVQMLLRRLALLGDVDFASWVGAPLLDISVQAAEELLDRLVEARLVEARVMEDGSARFQLHTLVRIYAAERLAAAESAAERNAALSRVLGCFLSLAKTAHRLAYGGDFSVLHGGADIWSLPQHALDDLLTDPVRWFQGERPALVAAVFQAARAGFDELCWDLALTSVTLFQAGSYVDDWRATARAALGAVRTSGNRRGEAAMLYSLGILALTSQPAAAARDLMRAYRLFDELGDAHGRALTLGGMAFADRIVGRYDRALFRDRAALAAFQEVNDQIGVADMLKDMAQIEIDRCHYDTGEKLLRDALAISQKLSADRAIAQAQHSLAELALRVGRLEQAEEAFDAARIMTLASGDMIGQAYTLVGLGATRTKQAAFERAHVDLTAALELADGCGDPLLRGRTLLALGELDIARQLPVAALARLNAALSALDGIGSAGLWRSRVLLLAGRLHEQAGRPAEADQAWQEALHLAHGEDPVLVEELSAALARLSSPGGTPSAPRLATGD